MTAPGQNDPATRTKTADLTAKPHARGLGAWILTGVMVLIALCTLWFVEHASRLGLQGLTQDLTGTSRLYSDRWAANVAIFGHMIFGAVITLLAPLQLIPPLRQRWPALHRMSGRVIVMAALATAVGGLAYMALRGTVGGPAMTAAFTLYGLLVAICAVQTIRFARAGRWLDHRDWALRLFFLCIASLLYRVHYGLWLSLTPGCCVQDDFRGTFDLINIWAFYVPYLFCVELGLARQRRGLFARALA